MALTSRSSGTFDEAIDDRPTFNDTLPVLPDTTDLTLDYLKVPTSAAFTLMGLAPTLIDEPKVPGDFLVSLNHATDDFTTIPRSYALEFSPAWVFDSENIDFSRLVSNKLGDNIKQSLVLSLGINQVDDMTGVPGNMNNTQVGFGVKASIIRGRVKSTFKEIDDMYKTLSAVNDSFYVNTSRWLETDPEYASLTEQIDSLRHKLQEDNTLAVQTAPQLDSLARKAEARSNELLQDESSFQQQVTSRFSKQLTQLKEQGNSLKFDRQGFKLDFAAGFVSDFTGASFDSTRVSRIGAWLTGGWTFSGANSPNASSILGVARLIGNPNQLYRSGNSLLTDDNLFFDFGGRLIFHNGKKLSISGELIGRYPINNDLLSTTTRYTFNFEYQASNSIVLTFNLGKDFNGTVTESGNLLTAIHLFSYFGNRSFNNNGNQVSR